MRPDRQVDLVPPLAIVAGAVVSVVVTYLAFIGSGDERAVPVPTLDVTVVPSIEVEVPESPVFPAILYWPEAAPEPEARR